MYLFFDTETSGLPKRWDAPVSDLRNWPRLVQIAWITCDSAQHSPEPEVQLIRPEGFTISSGAFQQHGISTQFAIDNGVPLKPVLDSFFNAVQSADVLVGHNFAFDANIVGAEFIRAGMINLIPTKASQCTMKGTTDFCKLPGSYGYKWPTLIELHQKLFKTKFEDSHDAAADCLACMTCFFRLKELRVMP